MGFESEHVAVVVFELTVPLFIVATTESPADDVNKGAKPVIDAVPEASVVAVKLWPVSGPAVTVKVTIVPARGSPFDKTTAVLVMLEPHITEEFTGESTMVGTTGGTEHPLMMVS